jgi:methylglyoxal reductase
MHRTTASDAPDPRKPRRLGRSGIVAHPIGIGCWAIGGLDWNLGLPMGWDGADDDEARQGIAEALRLGANLFDTADVYGHGRSERLLGAALADWPRATVVLATKIGYFSGTAPNPYLPLHMRHQLEMSLSNLGTDYLDIYFFHNLHFGEGDRYLAGAVDQMRRFKQQGLIRAIGMRGPHTYALDHVGREPALDDKRQRFVTLAELIEPDIIGIRYNMLTPAVNEGFDIVRWAADRDLGVLMYKPLAQGLLLDKYDLESPPSFPDGDHRSRKRWFRPENLRTLHEALAPIRRHFGLDGAEELVHFALEYCLCRSEQSVAVAGFRTRTQVRTNLSASRLQLSGDDIEFIQATVKDLRGQLGPYFDGLDE